MVVLAIESFFLNLSIHLVVAPQKLSSRDLEDDEDAVGESLG